jgi:hypothetical protein
MTIAAQMSASGPKQTLFFAPQMSAFGGKADIGWPVNGLGLNTHATPYCASLSQ